jgi:inorganic triphosphatase YgiF
MLSPASIRLASTIDDLPRVKQVLLDMATDGHEAGNTLTSTCYDTAAGRLKSEGLVLCVHNQDRRYTQTLEAHDKIGTAGGKWEDVVATDQLDLAAPNTAAHLPQALFHAELQARFTIAVRRTLFRLEPDAATRIDVAVAEGEIRAVESERTEPISDVELELERGDPAALYGFALRLLDVAPSRIAIDSLTERGYSLLKAAVDERGAQDALPYDLKPDMTVEETLQRIGWGCLTMLLRHERAALAGNPEGVHQMRVAVRRLRSVLNAVKRMLPHAQYHWVSRELKWLADILGPARNWHVFSSAILAPVRSVLLSDRDLEDLRRVIQRECRSAQELASAAIRSAQYTTAVLKLAQWFASRSWRDQPVSEQSALLMAPIAAVAPGLIARRHKKAQRALAGFSELTPEQRHAVRIAIKKLRYTIEFLGGLYETDRVEEFLGVLKPLQDELGQANDVRVGNELMASLQISDDAAALSRAGGIVLGWHDRSLSDHDPRLRKRVRRLRSMRPFW